ncbi:helix-turn-helix domain-containing protein [Paenibacillus sp. FSL H3-0286]|uniref:helix-turn-helix domain-containing protein n=1 Tax=Paenibacillus sp. FSL H3-0286 TaxID=2921427 RepID=UPI003253116A
MSWVEIMLENILTSKDISRRELARKTQIRPSTINEMCNNTSKMIPLENIASICVALEIEISDLFKLHNDETKKEEL